MTDLWAVLDQLARDRRPDTVPDFGSVQRRRSRRQHRQLWSAAVVTTASVVALVVLLPSRSTTELPVVAATGVPGASRPSPAPDPAGYQGNRYPELCDADPVPADAQGHLTSPVSVENRDVVLLPPGAERLPYDRAGALRRYGASDQPVSHEGRVVAVLGLMSAAAPAHVNADGTQVPEYDRTPVWMVVACGVQQPGHSGPARPRGTIAAPGTAAVRDQVSESTVPLRADGTAGYGGYSQFPSDAERVKTFVTVPWHVTGLQAMGGRQVGISYAGAGSCARFDHLAVQETPSTVKVQVWLQLLDPAGPCSGPPAAATVGLVLPLGTRPLVDPARAAAPVGR